MTTDPIPPSGGNHGGARPGAGRKPRLAAATVKLVSEDLGYALECLTHDTFAQHTSGPRSSAIAHVRQAMLRLDPSVVTTTDDEHGAIECSTCQAMLRLDPSLETNALGHRSVVTADEHGVAITEALYSQVGETSVTLEADSKGQIKPKVTVVHRDSDAATRDCQRLFDDLAVKYWRTAAPAVAA